ncbi:IS66 family insertion sequence element accessory protein TnpB [Myroides pelagicus]|uniref:IS66 family insertion sequence element accessory protein TnpA n=1 Tax=Myroides pelagicus TaxID=270914 RepID=UPI002DBD36DB|nr:IS66 family insertion sequence element accessory protein TnpB [Myroides pelagicus]MEC4114963.1 IS66 family insertion sequence element accessory protein TnpB [Myroides pelagicus]
MSRQEIIHQHVENWQQSGLTQAAYCVQENLKVPTFNYWVNKYQKQYTSSEGDSSFITIAKQASLASGNYEIVYPNGVTLRINTSNLAELSTLLKLI